MTSAFSALIDSIKEKIRNNGERNITGGKLQNILVDMVDTIDSDKVSKEDLSGLKFVVMTESEYLRLVDEERTDSGTIYLCTED